MAQTQEADPDLELGGGGGFVCLLLLALSALLPCLFACLFFSSKYRKGHTPIRNVWRYSLRGLVGGVTKRNHNTVPPINLLNNRF